MNVVSRLGLWPARLIWLAMPLTFGPAAGRALEAQDSSAGLAVEVLLWLAWFIVLVSVLTPSPRSLTIARAAGPMAVAVAVIVGFAEGWDSSVAVALGGGGLFVAVTALPEFGDRMINGSAYGSERRMALRPPAVALLGPIQVAWTLVFVGLVAAPLLVLSERWPAAAVAAVVGAGAVWVGSRVLYQLARRWIVFVPAGFVIHDPMTLVDSVLLRRNEVAAVGPALTGDEAERTDLSGGALGLAVEVELKKPTPITLRRRRQLDNVEVSNLVFTPTLPGAMLSEARIRGLKIGSVSG